MKKAKMIGKKTLSVFLAVLMVLTAWVWVAPTEASAAAGTYDVKINWYVTDEMDSNGGTITLKTKGNNGTNSSATTHAAKSWVNSDSATNNKWSQDFIWTGVGFPYGYNFTLSDTFWPRELNATLHVYVRKSGSSDAYTEVGTHSFADWGDNTTHNDNVFTIASGKTPVATTFTWSDTPETMYCPKTGTATQNVAVTAVDQYGVQMYDPTWSVKGSSCGTSGISVTSTTTASASTTITLTNSGNNTTTTDTQTGTVTATWGSATSSKTFTIYDSYYTATFNYKAEDATDTSATRNGYHGDTITPPSPPQYYDGDYLKTFSAWSPTINTTITKDITYAATYTQQFVEADYTAINDAIAAADAIKAQYGTEYELKYTLASRLALDAAINAVVTGLGRTQQDVVDGYAQAINDALNLEPNKFDVIFLDKNGAILLYEKDVEYKEAVTAPSFPDDQKVYYDSTNHYTFTGWDTDEYRSVVDDLVIQPVFSAEAHTFTTSVVPSTCMQKGATKYTCSCGYSYIDGETNYGDHVWDTDYTVDLEPTCTVAGSKSIHCSLCDAQKDITVIDPLGHNFTSQSVAVEATCGKVGIITKVCDDCLYCEHTIIPALEHDYKETVVAPTCTTKGYTEYVCQRADCGHSYRDNYTNVAAHSYGAWETVSEAYCGVAGVKKQTCTECGHVNIGSIDALQHNLSGWTTVVDRTCTGKGYQVKTCSLCNNVIEEQWLDTLGHNYVEKTVVAPTCTAKGYTIEECDRANCGAQRIVDEKPAKGHAWTSTTHAADCTHSAYVEHVCGNDSSHNYVEYVSGSTALTHDFTGTETIIKAANCTEDGKKTVKCIRCDVTNEVIIPKLGHNYGEWDKTTNPATNDKDGTWTRECANCHNIETITIPKGGHNFVEDITKYVAPKCNAKGQRVYKCGAHENCIATVTVELDYAQHTIVKENKEATCTTAGYAKTYCSVCEEVFNSVDIPVKAHEYKAGDEVAPTCTTSGYTPYKCENCTSIYNMYDENQPATGHVKWNETSRKNATCTADGSVEYKCEKCTATKTEVLPKTGHNYVEDTTKATEATCTALATKTYKCSCGASYVKHEGTLAAHKFDTLVKTVPATNESLGYEERKCVCGLTEITILEATGTHVFDEKIENECIAPTCTENGTDVYKCKAHTDCGVKSSVLVPRLGHSVIAVYNAPTCTAEGSSEAYCEICKNTVATTEIPAIGHAYNTVEVTTEPGCENEGVRTYSCSCGATRTEEIPAKGHSFKTTVKDATCEGTGLVVTECTVCKKESAKTTIELAAKNHNWNDGEITTPATCTNGGVKTYTCTICGETKTEDIDALGHNWDEWIVTPSTNNDTGSVSRECLTDGCDETETVVIPAGAHNLVEASREDASCTKPGSVTYTCNVTHEGNVKCGISVTVPLAMTQHKLETTKTDAKCEANGEVVTKCKNCDTTTIVTIIPATGHSIKAIVAEATCTTAGSVIEKCTADGCDYKKTVKSLPALGHDFSGEESDVKDATCTADGSKTVKCTRCDKTTTVIIPKLGHIWDGWEVVTEATNTVDGEWKRTCSNGICTETLKIPAGGHTFDRITPDSKTDATCTTEGSATYKCKTEGHTCGVEITVTIPVTPHSIAQREILATCKVEGKVEAYCSICNDVLSTEIIPVKAHEHKAGTPVAPTCTTSGYTPYICSCGDTYNVYDVTKPATGHTLVEGDSTADCTTAGKMTLTCKNCTYSTAVEVPALGHNYQPDGTTEATCKAAATKTYKCSRCADSYTISVGDKATAHIWGAWEVKESATASSLGYQTSTCSVCGQIKVETIPATGEHNFNTVISRQEATCTEKGWIDYKCSTHTDCGKTSRVELPATGHTEDIKVEAATCIADGKAVQYCTTCKKELKEIKLEALGHNWDDGVITNATCKDKGKMEYTCKRTGCGATHETEIAVNLNAHQYETTVVKATCTSAGSVVTKCKLCQNEIENETLAQLNHNWDSGAETTAATCTTEGVKTFKCSLCSTEKTEPIAKSEHNWGEWVKTDATNSKDGEWKRICKTNENHVETLVIPKGGHTFKDEPDSTTPATCTATGTATYNCTAHTGENACGVTITVTLDKLQHELETTKTDAKCEANGEVVTKCKNCDTTTIVTIIPATGHTYDDGVKTNATCTQTGKIVYTCTAKDCGKIKEVILDMLQHEYKAGTSVAPTCTSSGYTPYKCKTCDSSYVILGEAAKGHNYEKVVSSTATCGKAGKITLECTECADTMTADVDAIGHNYVKISSTEATCAAAATETYKCNNCDAEYTVSVGSKTEDHDFGEWVTVEKASYDSIGYKTRTCKVCSKLEVETIPATGSHNLVEFKRDNATCTAEGKIYYACNSHADCGVTDEVVIPKLGHEEALSYKAASCTEAGYTKIVCSRCGELENKTIDKLDHSFEITEIKNSTCAQTGTISLKCKNCTETKIVDIPVNADAHKFTSTTVAATCKSEGSITVICENGCGYKKITPLDKLQHKWNSWSVTTPSTNGAEGEMTRTCDNGCIETVKIPAGGHAFGKEPDSIIPASCTAEGTATYKCTEHTNCGVEITVKLDKVQHSLVTDIKEATCTEEGHVRVYCTKCEYDKAVNMTIGKLAHSDKVIETKPATCTTAAYTTYECENCHRAFSKLDAQPSGHRYLNEGAVVVTNATCETAGYTTYNCDNCDETHTVNLVAAKGHSWTEWTVEKAATNAEKGILSRTCINGCGKKETAEIPAGGHSFNTDEPSATTDGTCLVKGTKTFKCSVHSDCGVTITVETEFGAHNWSEWTKVDATNDKDGSWKRECTVCHETETHVIPKGNHTFGDKPSSTVPATCKKTGTATYNCTTHTNCGVTITVVLYMIQHTPKVDKKDASCTAIGYVKTYCEKCNDVISYVELPATGHINTSVVREESTCIKKGTEKVICACGHIVSVKELPFAEHNYEMTYENGVYTYTCKVEGCKHSYTETVETTFTVKFFAADKKTVLKTEAVKSGEAATAPAAPSKGADDNYHYTFSEWDRDFSEITSDLDVYPTYEKEAHYGGAATCTEKAVCDECGTGYGETDASKHVIDTKVTPATCEKDGVLEYYCTENGCTYSKTEVIKKTGHSLGAWETYQNGNCATPTIKIRKCRNNGCKYYEQKESYGSHTWYIQPEVAPTCTTVGYSEYKYCTTCGMEIDSVVIPKLNHRDNDGDGNCDYCTYTEPVLKCSCMCHSTGFMKFIYSIVRFFWIITKSQPACNCGAKHY